MDREREGGRKGKGKKGRKGARLGLGDTLVEFWEELMMDHIPVQWELPLSGVRLFLYWGSA